MKVILSAASAIALVFGSPLVHAYSQEEVNRVELPLDDSTTTPKISGLTQQPADQAQKRSEGGLTSSTPKDRALQTTTPTVTSP